MSCIARTLGAPETVPAGQQAPRSSTGLTPGRSPPATPAAGGEAGARELEGAAPRAELARDLRDEVGDVREALGLEEALDPDAAGAADPREVVTSEVDEHHVLGPVLLGGE